MLPRIVFTLFLIAAIAPLRAADGEDITYAERLGWPKGSRVVIFHSDDLGMSHETNTGSIEAMEKGLVTSASVMMPCPWVPEIVKYIKTKPRHDFGLHLTMTSEWDAYRWGPLAGKNQVPGMVDLEGCLWGGVSDVLKNATADEIELEIRAQIDRAETMGFDYTHLDSHMGTLFSSPEYFKRYMKVGIEKQVPILICGGHMTYAKRGNPLAVALLRPYAKQVWDAGLPVLDDIFNETYGWKDPETKLQHYIDLMREIPPGVTEVINHCIHDTEHFDNISTSKMIRVGDWAAMVSPELRKVIEEEGIILTTWRELMERRQAVKE